MSEALEAWKGEWGDEYTERNARSQENINARAKMFREIFKHCISSPPSILEVGANAGSNLEALRSVCPDAFKVGVEPNETAATIMGAHANCGIHGGIECITSRFAMVFTCGVLIHIPDAELNAICERIYKASYRYILSIEYFRPTLEELPYRGRGGLMWARDYGEYWEENFDVHHVAHGFFWKPATGLDNLTWWLFEK